MKRVNGLGLLLQNCCKNYFTGFFANNTKWEDVWILRLCLKNKMRTKCEDMGNDVTGMDNQQQEAVLPNLEVKKY